MLTKKEYQEKILEYQKKLKNILTEAEAKKDKIDGVSSIQNKIDQFSISKVENLKNYWNESVYNLLKKFEELQDDENFIRFQKGYNAATPKNDTVNKYVKPFVNELNENYLETRKDEIYEVLDDNWDDSTSEMDYTISKINNKFSRLIMPRNRRNVEVEDLDRNFWVIGQNLCAINDLLLKFLNFFGEDLIAEICGLWDNVYRLWQGIMELYTAMTSININEKVHILINIPSSNYKNTNFENKLQYFCYNDEIETMLNSVQSIGYTQEDVIESNKILLQKYNVESNSLIQIDCNADIQDDLRIFLKMIKEKNFLLLKGRDRESGKPTYDIVSLSNTKYVFSEKNGYKWASKTIKAEHLWIDFVCDEERGYIFSYTANFFGNSHNRILDYDLNISIPMYIKADNKNTIRYSDVIRINKPIPILSKFLCNGTYEEHIKSLNNRIKDDTYWLGFKTNGSQTEANTKYNCIDGFFSVDLSNYPTKYILDDNNLFFKFTNNDLFNIQYSSSDMISADHEAKGQTRINNYILDSYVDGIYTVNLRYLLGRERSQEIEVITSKDTVYPPTKIIPTLEIEQVRIGTIGFTGTIRNTADGTVVDKKGFYLCFNSDFDTITSEGADLYFKYHTPPANWRGGQKIQDNDGNFLWMKLKGQNFISQTTETSESGTNIYYKIKTEQFWNNEECRRIIELYLKHKYKHLDNYDFRIVTLSMSTTPWYDDIAGHTQSPGVKFLYLCAVYKINNEIKVTKLCNLGTYGYSFNFFGESDLEKSLKDSTETQKGNLTGAYCFYYLVGAGALRIIQGVEWNLSNVQVISYLPEFEISDNATVIIYNNLPSKSDDKDFTAKAECSINPKTGSLSVNKTEYHHLNNYNVNYGSSSTNYSIANKQTADSNIFLGKYEDNQIKISKTNIPIKNNSIFWNTSHYDYSYNKEKDKYVEA
jgi:hypothetical protein